MKTPGIIFLAPHRLPPQFCISNALEFGTTNKELLKTSVEEVSLFQNSSANPPSSRWLVTCYLLVRPAALVRSERQPGDSIIFHCSSASMSKDQTKKLSYILMVFEVVDT